MAAVLACGRGAALSHRTAADALGVLPYAGARIEITAPVKRTRPGLTVHRRVLGSGERTTWNGIPCTATARTLADLAAVVDARALAKAIEAAERLRILDTRAAEKAEGPGAARLRAALAAYLGDQAAIRSELERRALELFDQAGLARPRINTLIDTQAGPLEVDFCWPDRRLVVETDGFEHHGTRGAFERDRRRDQLLRAAGWTPVRVTWRQLNATPGDVIAAVAARAAD
jgi:hypothetical protein